MKNTKALITIFLIIIISNLVIAEDLEVPQNETATIHTSCFRNYELISNTIATITLYDRDGNILVPPTIMNNTGNGTHVFDYFFSDVGGYFTLETCDYGDLLADGTTGINVYPQVTGTISSFNTTIIDANLSQLINITNTNQGWLTTIWDYLIGFINVTINNINTTVTNNSNTLDYLIELELNETSDLAPSTIIYDTNRCISGSTWTITNEVFNQFGQEINYPYTNCNITTQLDNQTYVMNWTGTNFQHQQTCPSPINWTFSITCT